MVWTLFELARHPDIAARVAAEAERVLGSTQSVQLEDIGKLELTHACLKEALRLYPPVPAIGRNVTQPFRLNGKCYGMEKSGGGT